jgi:hypothetical protein
MSTAFAERAGKVSRVLPAGFITHETKTAAAKPADPVEWNDVVRTNPQGRVRIALEDQSLLTVGSQSEMRILKHDPASQQTSVELLYGRIRSKVTKLTKKGGSYNVRTPVAVVGVIGTEFILDSPATVTTVTREQLEQLPTSQRSFSSLLDLKPGTFPGATPAGELNISDFKAVDVNRVYSVDGVTAVKNIDPKIPDILYLLPGEAAIIERGKAPRRFNPRDQKDQPETLDQAFFGVEPNCPGLIDLSTIEKLPGGASYKIFGRGGSTGDTFEVEVTNPDPSCPLNVFVSNGTVLKPKGFVKRAVIGALLGGGIPIGNYQLMISEGGSAEIAPASPTSGTGMHFTAAAGGTASFTLRGFCLELHKAPPAPHTEYEFDTGKTREYGGHRNLIEAVHRMFHQGTLRPTVHDPDSIIQWSLWARREKMKEGEFKDEFSKLVKQNLEKQKKWNKDTKKEVETSAADLWDKVQKVLAATPAK